MDYPVFRDFFSESLCLAFVIFLLFPVGKNNLTTNEIMRTCNPFGGKNVGRFLKSDVVLAHTNG